MWICADEPASGHYNNGPLVQHDDNDDNKLVSQTPSTQLGHGSQWLVVCGSVLVDVEERWLTGLR